jgi:hypothetical protein
MRSDIMLDGLSLLAGAIGAIGLQWLNAKSGLWQAQHTVHASKVKVEFENLRTRLEGLHRHVSVFTEAIMSDLLECQYYRLRAPSLDLDKSKVEPPKLPDLSIAEISMIVEFFAQELQPTLFEFMKSRQPYLRERYDFISGKNSSVVDLNKSAQDLYKCSLKFKSEIEVLHRSKTGEHLAPPSVDPLSTLWLGSSSGLALAWSSWFGAGRKRNALAP